MEQLTPTIAQFDAMQVLINNHGFSDPGIYNMSQGQAGRWIRNARELLVKKGVLSPSVLKQSVKRKHAVRKNNNKINPMDYRHMLSKDTIIKTITTKIYADNSIETTITTIGDKNHASE